MLVRNIALLLEYDGSGFAGWQRQENAPSIQAELERALEKLLKQIPILYVAGRTDAGVHALGQVVSCKINYDMVRPAHRERLQEVRRLVPALNKFLPQAITVHRVVEVAEDFNARHDSLSKRYAYTILATPQRSPLLLGRAWHLRWPLDLDKMRQAAQHLQGELDFESFRSVHCDAAHARRHMFEITLESENRLPLGQLVKITYHANAFCRHMCRIITGTLVEVGLGKRSVDSVQATLLARNRQSAGITAPAAGLTLLEVRYKDFPAGCW